mgnify:CR=1 FL=1|jgi:hypothetical protein|tara:strand:- start:218 stop:400 length:183 start_codon:yes stop_codon:yes gene_type:complete
MDDLIIISNALASSIKGIEAQGNLSEFLPELIVEFNLAIYMTHKQLFIDSLEKSYEQASH